MKTIRVISFCDGKAGGLQAFKRLPKLNGVQIEYHAIEICKNKRALADSNFPGTIRPTHNIYELSPRMILMDLPVFDYVIAGPTCKSLSRQSNGKGLDGSSAIFFEVIAKIAILKWRNPNIKILIENVASMDNEERKILDEVVTFKSVLISSSLVSGQARERLYWANWEVSQPRDKMILAQSVIDGAGTFVAWSKSTRYVDADGKVHSSPAPGHTPRIEERHRKDGKANTLVCGKGCRGPSTRNFVLLPDGSQRPISVREAARLQTIDDSFSFDAVSENQAYKAIGDGWTIDVIAHILSESL